MARAVKASAIDETLLKLAVLLQAGVSPARAWTFVADGGDQEAARVSAGLAQGMTLSAAIATAAGSNAMPRRRRGGASAAERDARRWQDVAAAWQVATAVGAPLADSLRALSVAVRDAQEAADDVRIALAEPAGTAKLMGWLPLVAILLGFALGFDTLGTLVASPIGIACLVLGLGLIIAAQRWNSALVRRARSGSGIPGLDAELLAIALSGGVSIDRARRLVSEASGSATDPATESVLELSRTAGVPAVELLRASSAWARHRARVEGRLRAARLSTRLLLPLGVCTLPAFLLLGVAPMLLSVMNSVPLPI
ncbi:tight adherence protein B [Microbacterium sp. cf046]|uniref:type II secretion system F family protein n=1 Tax=Microbacterium sp. cf046 TaxID=1761803 RepID=UPI0008E259A0|nr:type II secretion system F family protein [Microbacterium sp. cf046]SFS16406.1 tight adherence protein B [Microbacterium sp. cf046]